MAFNHPACHRKMGFTYICGNFRKIGQGIAKNCIFLVWRPGRDKWQRTRIGAANSGRRRAVWAAVAAHRRAIKSRQIL